MGVIPKTLFRFRSLDGEARFEQELDAITNSYLYASKFEKMNDPMEAFFEKEILGESGITALMGNAGRVLIEKAKSLHSDMWEKWALVSFSSTMDVLSMWAYYADNFSGICLEYDPELLEASFTGARFRPVTYGDKPLSSMELQEMMENGDSTLARMSHKLSCWCPESEWRWIFGVEGKHAHLDGALKRVYLGPRIKEEQAQKIKAALADRHVEIMQPIINGFTISFEVAQNACPLDRCSRIGSGKFDRDLVCDEGLSDFLSVTIDSVYHECDKLVKDPNLEEICHACLCGKKPNEFALVFANYKMRNGSSISLKHIYDKNMHSTAAYTRINE